jgi:ERCC4-type nuclease
MDLGDGITMKVPLPKNKVKSTAATIAVAKSQHRKSLGAPNIKTSTVHEIKSERLPLGDIILHDPTQGQEKDIVIFERKTLNDLAASIQDGRYKEQSFRLSQSAADTGFDTHNIIYIIEGDIARYDERHSRITSSALQSAIVSLLYYKGFSVIRTMNIGETADFIVHFADKIAKEGALVNSNAGGVQLPHKQYAGTTYSDVAAKKERRDYITRENIGEIMLAQVPGVSPKISAAILSKYGGSIYEFLADLHRKLNDYEESVSPELSPPSPVFTPDNIEPMNKNKLKHVSECFKDVGDGKRNIGKATIEKLCYFLS